MADYKVKYIVHYQVTARRYRRPEVMETKEFDTKWEAEKFLEEWRKSHWFADVGWVEQKVIDCRCPSDKALADKANETVSRYLDKMWRNWKGF